MHMQLPCIRSQQIEQAMLARPVASALFQRRGASEMEGGGVAWRWIMKGVFSAYERVLC